MAKKISAAQRMVDDWLVTLCKMDKNDPRLSAAIQSYEEAVSERNWLEQDFLVRTMLARDVQQVEEVHRRRIRRRLSEIDDALDKI